MQIKSLTLKNFKNFSEQHFDFGKKNKIEGHNGAGKSAIKDAIMFALYNRTPDGSAQNTDTFIKREEGFAMVTVELDDGNKIVREKSEKSTRLNFIDFSQTEEDARVAQRDLEGTVIPDFDNFASVFNVGYFMNSMDEKDQRAFIMNLTPAIDRMALFTRAGGDLALCRAFGINPEYYNEAFKKVKEYKHENKIELEKTRAQLDYVQEQTPVNYREVTVDLIEQEYNDLDHAIKAKQQLMRDWDKYRSEMTAYEAVEKANEANIKSLAEITNLKIVPREEPTRELVDRLRNAASKLLIVNLPKGTCPTCLQEIGAEHADGIRGLNEENAAKRKKLQLSADQEEDHYNKRLKKFHDTNQAIREKDVKIKMLSANIITMMPPKSPTESEPDQIDMAPLQSLREIINHKINESKFIDEIKKYKAEQANLDQLYNLFCPTGLPSLEAEEKIKPVEAKLQEYVKDCKIVIMRLLKNGMEYKDTFDIELSGKRYARLSSGEKKKLDFAISMVINKFLRQPVSMLFMDDSDLIDDEGINTILAVDDSVQLFTTHVTNDNLKLTI